MSFFPPSSLPDFRIWCYCSCSLILGAHKENSTRQRIQDIRESSSCVCMRRKLQGRGSRKEGSKSISAASGNHCAHSPPFPVKKVGSHFRFLVLLEKHLSSLYIFFTPDLSFFFSGQARVSGPFNREHCFSCVFFKRKNTPDIAPQWVSWKKRSHGSIGPDFFVEFCAHFLWKREQWQSEITLETAPRDFFEIGPYTAAKGAVSRFRPIKIISNADTPTVIWRFLKFSISPPKKTDGVRSVATKICI